MIFVPIVPPPQPPSPRTRELADRLAWVLQEYEKAHPSVTAAEMRQATQLALRSTRTSSLALRPILAALVGLVVLGAGIVAFLAVGEGGSEAVAYPIIAVLAGIGVVAALIAATRKNP